MSVVTRKIQTSKKLPFKNLSVGDVVYHYFLDSKMLSSIPENNLIEKMNKMLIEHEIENISKEYGLITIDLDNGEMLLIGDVKDITLMENIGSDNSMHWNCYSTYKQPEAVLDYIENHINRMSMVGV